jgi:hypothetical protein
MHRTIAIAAAAVAAFAVSLAAAEPPDYAALHNRCTQAYAKNSQDVPNVLAECEQAAAVGVPAAQYVMGALLVNAGSPEHLKRGVEWLEKAVASGSVPAAYQLATVLVLERNDESQARGRDLFRRAVCLGYPPALADLREEGLSIESMRCAKAPNTDFDGEWVVAMKWGKTSEAAPEDSYKINLTGSEARVFVRAGGEWLEVKSGKFTARQFDQSLRVSATDEGWDFDGKWIETWTFDLLRTASDESFVAYLRTVNNPYMPAHLSWQTFSEFVEGTARRRTPQRRLTSR